MDSDVPQRRRARPTTSGGRKPDRALMSQVAERAGVAMSSVSRVLNGHADVSESMRARVMSAVEEFGYEPNVLGQMLRQGATKTIGFIVGDISNPLQSRIALGAEIALDAGGYAMLLVNSGNDPQLDANHIRLLQRRHVDGLLLSVADETNRATLDALSPGDTPYVLIDRELEIQSPPCAVISDHRGGMTTAVEHLVALGHRRIALVGGSPHVRPTRERIAGIEEAVAFHKGASCQVRSGAFTEGHGSAATRELLDGKHPPTAIIAGGNQILVGVLREIRARSLSVPDDLSLVTCDNVPLAEFLSPALATIHRDPVAMGTAAAELLLAQLGNAQGPHVVTLPATFDAAESCAPPPSTTKSRRTTESHPDD